MGHVAPSRALGWQQVLSTEPHQKCLTGNRVSTVFYSGLARASAQPAPAPLAMRYHSRFVRARNHLMRDMLQFYIAGRWVDPVAPKTVNVINPATEEAVGRISMGSAEDVDRAVAAAKAAFPAFSATAREERIELLEKILEVF